MKMVDNKSKESTMKIEIEISEEQYELLLRKTGSDVYEKIWIVILRHYQRSREEEDP